LTANTAATLNGVCTSGSSSTACTVPLSLAGGASVQISGSGFTSAAASHSACFVDGTSSSSAACQTIDNDSNFNSDPMSGTISYSTPGIQSLIDTEYTETYSSYNPVLFLKGPLNEDGTQDTFACSDPEDCKVSYGIAYTPLVSKLYPSTVYPGQDFCLSLFGDLAGKGGREILKSIKTCGYTTDTSEFDEANEDASVNEYYNQKCASLGGAMSSSDCDVKVSGDVGDAWIEDWAKTSDGDYEYTMRIIPKVNGLSSNELYKNPGSIVTVEGEGFDPIAENNEVQIDDLACDVIEASTNSITCQLPEKTSDTTASFYIGGTGAHAKEYKGVNSNSVSGSTTPTRETLFTDLEGIRGNPYISGAYSRSLETWFIAPRDGDYVFHASCDDRCNVSLSTVDGDPSAATTIISTSTWEYWSNYFYARSTDMFSSPISLVAGEHYYMSVKHDDYGGSNHMQVGFTIQNETDIETTSTWGGWAHISMDPHHTFEQMTLTLPNDTETAYKVQFKSEDYSGELLKCSKLSSWGTIQIADEDLDGCLSGYFKASYTNTQMRSAFSRFFNSIHSDYGDTMTVVKKTLDASGQETDVAEDISSYQFVFTGNYALNKKSFESVRTFTTDGETSVVSLTYDQESTKPLTGSYKIRVTQTKDNGQVKTYDTEDIPLDTSATVVRRMILEAWSKLIGRLEFRRYNNRFLSYQEGLDFYYSLKYPKNSKFTVSMEIINSSDDPLTGGSETLEPTYTSNDTYIENTVFPFFEAIPAHFLRTVEYSPQVVVKTNGLLGACPSQGSCDVSFIDSTADIHDIEQQSLYTFFILTGTNIPFEDVEYVSFGTLRKCTIDPAIPASATEVKCDMPKPIAGNHGVYVQTTKGALSTSYGTVDIPILIDSVLPSTVASTGGQILTITGDFFPQSLSEAKSIDDFSIKLIFPSTRRNLQNTELECSLQSAQIDQLTCLTPAGLSGSPVVQVTFNGISQNMTGTLSVSTVTESVVSVSPSAVSPTLKQDLVIEVSSTPSSNVNDYEAIIESAYKTTRMKVNAVDTSAKTLTVRFPGSPKGYEYYVNVVYNGARYNSDVILDARSEVTGAEITTNAPDAKDHLSHFGGDLIKLTGTGFSSTLSDNIVVFGNDKVATIVSATVNEMVIRAPYIDDAYFVGDEDGLLDVGFTVYLKPNIVSYCNMTNTCQMSYQLDTTQTLTDAGTDFDLVDGIVTVTGTGFGANAVGYIGNYAQETISSTDTEVQIRLTKMDNNEEFNFEIRTDTVNLPPVKIAQPLIPRLISVSPNSGSLGGQTITLTGSGFGLMTVSDIDVYYGTGSSAISICQKDTITFVNSATITCVTEHDLAITSTDLRVSLTHVSTTGGGTTEMKLVCTNATACEYQTDSSITPTVTSFDFTGTTMTVDVDDAGLGFDSTYTVKIKYANLEVDSTTSSLPTVTASFTDGLPVGENKARVAFEKDGSVIYTSGHLNDVALSASVPSTVDCSWAGGCKFEITQSGLVANTLSGDVTVKVCGQEAEVDLDLSSGAGLIVRAPKYVSSHSLDNFNVEDAHVIYGEDSSASAAILRAFDSDATTQWSSSSNNCELPITFPEGKVGRVQKLKFFMGRMTDKMKNFVGKLKFQSSSDGTTWNDEYEADALLRQGWNDVEFASNLTSRSYRFFSAYKSACKINEVQLWGNVVDESTDPSVTCDVEVLVPGGATQSFTGKVVYKDEASSKIDSISPRYGTYKGGETVTITGEGFSTTTSEISVSFSGTDCVVNSATTTEIQCTTGASAAVPSDTSTTVLIEGSTVNGYSSMQGNTYKYATYWTDNDIWGQELAPTDGDSVIIPKEQTLVFDGIASPILKAVIVQGALIFAPDADPTHQRTFDAEYIFVDKGGVLEIGTEEERYTSKLTITMHGVREDPQIPIYGNKGIFVRFGTLDIHGAERDYSWTELGSTMEVNTTQMTLHTQVDWQVDEEIVIAPTDFESTHVEKFTITAVDNTGTTTVLTVDRPCKYKHYAGVEEFNATNDIGNTLNKTLEMRAEVGLLSRSVTFKGADDDSVSNQYGAHIMLHSPGDNSVTGRISYTEFTQVGQAFQLGRYPIHFHMIGDVGNSYIKGNSIYHTYNRACTLHGVKYLTIQDNVAYDTMGHTFFIEDAAETNNHLERNLAVKTKRSWSLLNTDQTPASFWITHPDNQFIGNHAAGSDRYGFWFDLQEHSIGPSFDPNICPEYEQLGEFTGNVAHSNGRYGLRIFHKFVPSTNPCGPDRVNEEAHFRDFTGYKNKRNGIIVEELGDLRFHDIKVADNLFSGVEFGKTDWGTWLNSSSPNYHLQDALIVGKSANYEEGNTGSGITRGLKGARREKMRVKDTIFANFDIDSSTTHGAIGTCSHCEGPDTDSSGRTYFFKNLFFISTTQKVRFDTPFKEILYDEDGTLANSTHRWVIFDFPHLRVPECELSEATHNGLICNDTVKVRRIVLHHPSPANALKNLPIKVLNLKDMDGNVYPDGLTDDPSNDQCKALTTTSLADMQTNDDAALDIQNQLLQAFDDRATNFTAYEEAVAEFERTADTSYQTLATNFNTAVEEAQARIDSLEPQLEQYEGDFDLLWETDVNVCNATSHSDIAYRAKANPKNNWVINVITGYEYKIHIDQGATIESVTGEYSYAELLNGETDAAIIHLNTTERNEAWNFTYTDSSGAGHIVAPQQTWLSMDSATNAMGDVYFNNVTRHIQVKFDGQDSDKIRFEIKRDECISWGNCNPDTTEDAEIETTERLWSDPASWTSGSLPVEGDEVLIEPTWNMVYDLEDSPVFKSIEVNGRLTILNDGTDRTLRTYLIFIRKGELNVGSEAEPFTANMNFVLHGERADKDIYFHSSMFEGGNKAIANTGNLTMIGTEVDVKWTRLAASVVLGSKTLTLVDTPTTWKQGDELGIAPSGRDYTHRDKVTIESISGNTVNLTSGVSFDHYGAASIDSSVSGGIDIRAEVVHLSRNIKVSGTNEDRWGGHVVTAHNEDTQFLAGQLATVTRRGWAKIDSVEFVNCSQYDTDKAAVRFADITDLTTDDVRSYVKNSAVHDGLGIGIMVTGAEEINVDSNVVWFHHVGGIWMKKSHHAIFNNNVVAGMGTRYWSTETRLDELAAFNLCNKDQNCQNLTVTNNVAAGGERVGFAIPTVCDDALSTYTNNLAHTFQHGAFVLNNNLCSGTEYFGNFQAYKTMEQGVLTYQGYESIHVKNIETLDCGRGATIMIGMNQDVNQIYVSDSTFWGESAELPQDEGSLCIDIYGFWLAASSQGGKKFPETMLSSLPYEKIKTYNNWFTEATITNVNFKNWVSESRQNCASSNTKEQRALFINPSNSDHGPVNRFIDATFDNVAHSAMARLADPDPAWAIIKDCGNFPCTAPENVVFKFEGATFSGTNTPTITGDTFQIIPNNAGGADNIADCSAESDWNGNLCYNEKIAQLMFESLDGDKEDRMLSPIQIMSIDSSTDAYSGFNNTLNTFMDHCWDGHYTCQKRLSRFPSIAVMDSKHEIYYSGTPPGKSRYTLEGANDGEYMITKIDYSKSIIFHVYSIDSAGTKTLVESNRYNKTLGKPAPLDVTTCGANRYEQANFIYEFVLRYGCTVQLEAQEHMIGLARLQMSIDDFFEDDFVGKLSFALGITTDQIRIVSVTAGSTIISYQVTSTASSESEQRRNLVEMSGMLASQHAAGTLDLGAPILDLVNEVISSSGATVTSGTGDYSKKEVHASVYALIALSAIAVLAGVVYGIIKVVKMSKVYKEIANEESVDGEKNIDDQIDEKEKVGQFEDAKSQ
jgi:hypothetical protein